MIDFYGPRGFDFTHTLIQFTHQTIWNSDQTKVQNFVELHHCNTLTRFLYQLNAILHDKDHSIFTYNWDVRREFILLSFPYNHIILENAKMFIGIYTVLEMWLNVLKVVTMKMQVYICHLPQFSKCGLIQLF